MHDKSLVLGLLEEIEEAFRRREVLAHDYFNIDNEEIFNICSNDLPPLKQVVKKMREALS